MPSDARVAPIRPPKRVRGAGGQAQQPGEDVPEDCAHQAGKDDQHEAGAAAGGFKVNESGTDGLSYLDGEEGADEVKDG